ncbi:MAG TPA: hypothetical protein VGM30_22435 [Puia sp.]
MNPHYRGGHKHIYESFNRHYHDLWHSPWSGTWVMTINSRPAFCLTLRTGEGPGQEGPRPESGCTNQLFLLYPLSIRRSPRLVERAWYAATVFVLFKRRLKQVQVAVPESQTADIEALHLLGYRLIQTTTEGAEKTYLYLCTWEDFTPIL